MKKTTLAILGLITITSARAQEDSSVRLQYPTRKGNFMIGGSGLLANMRGAFHNDGQSLAARYNTGAGVRFGYFVTNNLAIGAEINGTMSRLGDTRSRSVGVDLFARYYFGKPTNGHGGLKKVRLFAEMGIGAARNASSEMGSEYTNNRFVSISPYAMAGVNYFVSKKVAIEAGLYYKYITADRNQNPFEFQEGQVGVKMGVQIFLHR